MKFVISGQGRRVGVVSGEMVIDVNHAYQEILRRQGAADSFERAATQAPSNLESFITAGAAGLDAAETVLASSAELTAPDADGRPLTQPLAQAKLLAPWPRRRIACVGGNYADHLAGMAANQRGEPMRPLDEVTRTTREAGQWGFWKIPDEVAGPGDTIPAPGTNYFDYEGEVAVILGRRIRQAGLSDIADAVWGVTLLNDWSKRDGMGAPRAMSYNLGKNFDRSTSMGPCIVVGEVGPQAVDIETRVNGELRQHYTSADMVFSFAEVLEFLSRDLSFVPGDVISGGTAAGTAADLTKPLPDGTRPTDLFLKVGDTVEVSSPQIGSLTNAIVAQA